MFENNPRCAATFWKEPPAAPGSLFVVLGCTLLLACDRRATDGSADAPGVLNDEKVARISIVVDAPRARTGFVERAKMRLGVGWEMNRSN